MEPRSCATCFLFYVLVQLLTVPFGVFCQYSAIQKSSNNSLVNQLCPELFSTSLDIDCFYEGNTTLCDDPMLNGTIARLKCKQSYYLENMPSNEIHCNNGKWNRDLFKCEPVCGRKIPKSIPIDLRDNSTDRDEFPWHVGLYMKMKLHYKYICGGSILSPKLIITAAHCISNTRSRKYKVAAGKKRKSWIHKEDDKAQYRDVVNIRIGTNYKGISTGYEDDIAILVLNEVFILSDWIHPICLDPSPDLLDISENSVGIVPTWSPSNEQTSVNDYLQYVSLPLKDYESCLSIMPSNFSEQFASDKICSEHTNGTTFCTADSGGGLITSREINNTDVEYFLIAIVSRDHLGTRSCDLYNYTTFTNIASHIDWIHEMQSKFENGFLYDYGCILPEPPSFGNYTIETEISNDEELFPGCRVPLYTKLKYTCRAGYRISGKEMITCKEKIWNSTLPTCFRTCPRLSSTDLGIEYLSDEIVDPTDNSIPHGTQALVHCKNINNELETNGYNQTTCQNGKWTNRLPRCIPICGVTSALDKHHLDRTPSFLQDFPWNVAIYKRDGNKLQLECAGSIISRFLVLTERKCVNQLKKKQYLVIAGTDKIFTKTTSDENAQQSDIYRKIKYDYFDIIILKTRLNMTSSVRPICVRSIAAELKKNNSAILEIPFWTQEEDKLIKYEGNVDLMNTVSNYISVSTNKTGITAGGLVAQIRTRTDDRYCIVGLGINRNTTLINMYVLLKADILFIKQVLERSNARSVHISECIVPVKSKNLRTTEYNYDTGDVVFDGTVVKYTCDDYYHLYGSDKIVCENGNWIYPSGKPYCMGCGISNLTLPSNIFDTFSHDIQFSTNPEYFPWNVYIYNTGSNYPQFRCRAVLISSKIALTNHHCVEESENTLFNNMPKYYVEVGRYNLNPNLNTYYQTADVKEILINGLYLKVIALILNKHLQINEHVLPVCLDVNGISRYVNHAAPGFFSFGYLEKENDTSTSKKVLYVSSYKPIDLFGDKLFIYSISGDYCENKTDNNSTQGTGLTYEMKINPNENRFFLQSIFMYSRCERYRVYSVDIFKNIKWIKRILNFYN